MNAWRALCFIAILLFAACAAPVSYEVIKGPPPQGRFAESPLSDALRELEAGKAAKHEERAAAVGEGEDAKDGMETTKSGPRMPREKKDGFLPFGESEGAERMLASMEERRAKRTEARIAELVAKLGLDSQQEARLRAHFDSLKPEVKVDEDGNSVRVNSMSKMSQQEREASLDKLMEEMLTTEQREAARVLAHSAHLASKSGWSA